MRDFLGIHTIYPAHHTLSAQYLMSPITIIVQRYAISHIESHGNYLRSSISCVMSCIFFGAVINNKHVCCFIGFPNEMDGINGSG